MVAATAPVAQPATVAAQVRPGPESALTVVRPCRLADTRQIGRSPLRAGEMVTVQAGGVCGIPAEAVAIAVSVIAVDPAEDGFMSVLASGATGGPATSTLNFRAGQVVSNSTISGLRDGQVSVFSSAASHFVLDVTGYFKPVSGPVAAGRFLPLAPARVLDTRRTVKPVAGSTTVVTTGIPNDGSAALVNITATDPVSAGYVTAYAARSRIPETSVLNFDRPGQSRASSVIVSTTNGMINLYASVSTHLIVDVVGYFTGRNAPVSEDGLFVALDAPVRLGDTRPPGDDRLFAGGVIELPVRHVTGNDAGALAANITVVEPDLAGWWQASGAGLPPSGTSSVNAEAGDTVANFAAIAVTDRGVSLTGNVTTDVLVDVVGWFTGPPGTAGPAAGNPYPDANRPVLMISDSAMAGLRWHNSTRSLEDARWFTSLESCRRLVMRSCDGREGYGPRTVVEELGRYRGGAFGKDAVLIVATGYNDFDTGFIGDIVRVIAEARRVGFQKIVWLSLREHIDYTIPGSGGYRSSYMWMNTVARALTENGNFPDLEYWDYTNYTEAQWQLFFNEAREVWDGVHQTEPASYLAGWYLTNKIAHLSGRPCVRPGTPGETIPNEPCRDLDLTPATVDYPAIRALYGI